MSAAVAAPPSGRSSERDPAPASTVLVMRDGPAGIEVYVQRRPASMPFAAAHWVFPGGRVDPADLDPTIDERWSGPPPSTWARRLGVSDALARGHLVAAYRETLEEAGILLVRDAPPGTQVAHARRALLDGTRSFADVARDLDLRLDTTLLQYWAWWVTPIGASRRYDTRFFLARMPSHADITPHDVEATDERWVAAGDPAALRLMPPTDHTLRDVLAHATTAAAMRSAAARRVTRVLPRLEGGRVRLPWDDDADPAG